jgi:hypothetical protein
MTSPKPHEWSHGVAIYEGIAGFVCKGCGARIMAGAEGPSLADIETAHLPEDCDEAIPVVIHEDYVSFDPEDCWNEDDTHRAPAWPDSPRPTLLQKPELEK